MTFDELIEAIGREGAERLARHAPGRSVCIPAESRLRADHPLVVGLGLELAAALCRLAAGDTLDTPSGRAQRRRAVHAEIRAAAAGGVPVAELARQTGLHVRHIRRIVRGC